MAKIQTKSKEYKGEKAYQKDLAKMLSDGWRVQNETMTEHRGAGKWLFLGIFALFTGKKRKYHVMYVKGGDEATA